MKEIKKGTTPNIPDSSSFEGQQHLIQTPALDGTMTFSKVRKLLEPFLKSFKIEEYGLSVLKMRTKQTSSSLIFEGVASDGSVFAGFFSRVGKGIVVQTLYNAKNVKINNKFVTALSARFKSLGQQERSFVINRNSLNDKEKATLETFEGAGYHLDVVLD